MTLAIAAAGVIMIGLAIAATMVASGRFAGRGPVTVAVMQIAADGDLAAVAADVNTRLSDGLAKIDNVRVVAPPTAAQDSGAARPDFVVSAEIGKREGSWEVQARMIRAKTGEVVWTTPVSVATDEVDLTLQQSRLAASIGQPLAQRINALINSDAKPNDNPAPAGSAGVAIKQALASITQTTRERFAASQEMLEKALHDDPGNVDLAVALAGLQLRGVQMVWFTPVESAAVETRARAVLERGLKRRPTYLPVLEAYCRFLNATNEFVESLVACARVLSFDPWNGIALYQYRDGSDSVGAFRRRTGDVQGGRSFRHAAGLALDLETRCGADLSADGQQRRRGGVAATLDRHHPGHRTQPHHAGCGLSAIGAAGGSKGRDGKGDDAAARLEP